MRLLPRSADRGTRGRGDGYYAERPLPDEAPEPQPERAEPTLADPTPGGLSKRDYLAILKRSVKELNRDHLTNISAALAYYAFLAIPSVLMIAVGLFGLLAGPHAVGSLVGRLHGVVPGQARTLIQGSLTRITQSKGTGTAVLGVGSAFALWSLTGAATNVMWAMNVCYDREETRGFLRKRLAALAMIVLALVGFGLCFGVLALGPHLSVWVGSAVGAKTIVQVVWWVAEWPLLVGGLLVVFAGMLYYGPNVEHPRWRFLSFGSVLAVCIWLAASGAFAFYVSRFGHYNQSWGSLSAVVVILTWFWLSSLALLLGAEVNAEAERSRELRRGEPAEVELTAPAKASLRK
jgi:membrane protein